MLSWKELTDMKGHKIAMSYATNGSVHMEIDPNLIGDDTVHDLPPLEMFRWFSGGELAPRMAGWERGDWGEGQTRIPGNANELE